MNSKISLIMPVYNAEMYIVNSIESVLEQSNVEIELIIVNDGSTDHTKELISKYKDNRLIYLEQDNRGVSSARNLALKNVTGDYIAFIDADDQLVANSLSLRLSEIGNNDLLISAYEKFDESSNICERMPINRKSDWSIKELLEELVECKQIGYQGYLWNKLFLTKIIRENSISFDENIYYGEDRLFVAKYLTYCKKCIVSNSIVYRYRINNQGAMALFNNLDDTKFEKLITEFKGIQEFETILLEHNKNAFFKCKYMEFNHSLKFCRAASHKATSVKKYAKKNMLRVLPCVILIPNNIVGIYSKIKAIGHVVLGR